MIRAVLDTNTIISGSFWRGNPWKVYDAALEGKYILLTSEALIAELSEVLERSKFLPALAAIGRTGAQLVVAHRELAELIEPAEIPSDAVRDPKDRAVLACAVGGKADFIVSGDKDLLVLGTYETIPIVSTDQFLQRLSSK